MATEPFWKLHFNESLWLWWWWEDPVFLEELAAEFMRERWWKWKSMNVIYLILLKLVLFILSCCCFMVTIATLFKEQCCQSWWWLYLENSFGNEAIYCCSRNYPQQSFGISENILNNRDLAAGRFELKILSSTSVQHTVVVHDADGDDDSVWGMVLQSKWCNPHLLMPSISIIFLDPGKYLKY